MANKQTLGEVIREARTIQDTRLRELARRLGVTPSYISDIENDRRVPSEEILRKIAAALTLDFEDLIAVGRTPSNGDRAVPPRDASRNDPLSPDRGGEVDRGRDSRTHGQSQGDAATGRRWAMKRYTSADGERIWFDDGEIDLIMEAELQRAGIRQPRSVRRWTSRGLSRITSELR